MFLHKLKINNKETEKNVLSVHLAEVSIRFRLQNRHKDAGFQREYGKEF